MGTKLTKKGFIEWLDNQDPASRPATCGHASKCILAKYLADITDVPGYVFVDGDNYGVGYTKIEAENGHSFDKPAHAVPTWANRVILDFDDMARGKYGAAVRPSIRQVRKALGL